MSDKPDQNPYTSQLKLSFLPLFLLNAARSSLDSSVSMRQREGKNNGWGNPYSLGVRPPKVSGQQHVREVMNMLPKSSRLLESSPLQRMVCSCAVAEEDRVLLQLYGYRKVLYGLPILFGHKSPVACLLGLASCRPVGHVLQLRILFGKLGIFSDSSFQSLL